MTKTSNLLVLLISLTCLFSCSKSSSSSSDGTTVGNWVTRSEFDGKVRTEAVAFTIGGFAYVGSGYFDTQTRLTDFWKYNPDLDAWAQVQDCPGVARNSAVAFAIGNNGYFGTGTDGVNYFKDWWQYDAGANAWTKKKDFAGTGRYDAVAFAIQGKGYVATGYDGSYLKDLWQYDPVADTFYKKVSMGGAKRAQAVAFVYNNKAYITTGQNNGSTSGVNDFWMYDPAQPDASAWTKLNYISNVSDQSFDDNYAIVRANAVAIVMGDYAYVTTGQTAQTGGFLKDTWRYNFSTDRWDKRGPYKGVERGGAIGFSVKNRGYVGMGNSSTLRFDDLREFLPDQAYNPNN